VGKEIKPCPFCLEPQDQSTLWCGGNVEWAHARCVDPWVYPTPPSSPEGLHEPK
jgi:hypothetical protein